MDRKRKRGGSAGNGVDDEDEVHTRRNPWKLDVVGGRSDCSRFKVFRSTGGVQDRGEENFEENLCQTTMTTTTTTTTTKKMTRKAVRRRRAEPTSYSMGQRLASLPWQRSGVGNTRQGRCRKDKCSCLVSCLLSGGSQEAVESTVHPSFWRAEAGGVGKQIYSL